MNVFTVDNNLVDLAKEHLVSNYAKGEKSVAAIIKTDDGRIFKAMNSRHFANTLCAELSAIILLINSEKIAIGPITIVAVIMNEENIPSVANSCGRCRQVIADMFSDARFIINADGILKNLGIDEILPFRYKKKVS